jgi:surface antigen
VLLAAVLLPVLVPRVPAASVAAQSPAPSDFIPLSATIERPSFAPELISRPAQTVLAAPGVSVDQLAAQYHVDVAALRWANDLGWGVSPATGSAVLLPPGPGALVRLQGEERPSGFAHRLGIDPRTVLDYNHLVSDAPLPAGTYLQVPVGAAPNGALNSEVFVPTSPGVPAAIPDPSTGSDGFAYGQCTWYVASKRDLSRWGGNARDWWWNAKRFRPEGHVPVAGAILVENVGWWGHVAYVEHVNVDGSFVISEMNWYENGGGWGRVDHRVLPAGDPGILGFIY